MITYKLNFTNGNDGVFDIDEPGGMDDFSFKLEQEKGRYGRDINFSENDLSFYRLRNHKFELLVYYFLKYGWESHIEFIIDFDGIEQVMGILDFKTAVTDQIEEFKCSIIDDDVKSLIKKREDIQTNVFSNKTIDDEDIEPVVANKMLFKSQPIRQRSLWNIGGLTKGDTSVSNIGGKTETRYFNPVIQLEQFDLEDAFIPFKTKSTNRADFEILKATDNIKDIEIKFESTSFEITADSDGGANGDVRYSLVVATASVSDGKILNDENGKSTLTETVVYSGKVKPGNTELKTGDFLANVPFLTRNKSILIYWKIITKKTSLTGRIESFLTFGEGMKISIIGTRIPFNTVVDAVRLLDAVKYNVKSISGGTVSFPMAEIGGEYYNHFLFTGKLLRNIKDDFNIMFKDLASFFKEFNGDYQINNGNILIAGYDDFYANNEIAVYNDIQFDGYEISYNKIYTLNKFSYEYTRFFSKREETAENTSETVHGKSSYVILNKKVEDKKEVKIEFIRDPFFIQQQINLAFEEDSKTATNTDEDIFIIHARENNSDVTFTESAELRHGYDNIEKVLSLVNDGKFKFTLLGIDVGSSFEILSPNKNEGGYEVISVFPTTVNLKATTAFPTAQGDGVRQTTFKYGVSKASVPLISVSNENITLVSNKIGGNDFANLEYTIGRNVNRFWIKFLSTANVYTEKRIKNTEYLHGKDVEITIDGVTIREGGDVEAQTPILLPFVHKIVVIRELDEFIALKNEFKTKSGFIRFLDNNGNPVRIYPSSIEYNVSDKELTIIGEEKAVSIKLDINNSNNGFIIINDFYVAEKITYKIENNIIFLFDGIGQPVARPTFWNMVSFNGKTPNSIEEIQLWLKSLL